MSDGPLFSVVIPTYGRARFLADAVRSVLDQTVADLECLVVDDASNEVADVPEDPRVRVLSRADNGGTAAARNTGLEAARGRYVTFLDDDDCFVPRRLELTRQALETAPVVVCWEDRLDGGPQARRRLDGDVATVIMTEKVPHVGATTVWRERAPRFDERLRCGEDAEWWLRLAQAEPVQTVAEVGLLRRIHDGPRFGKSQAERARARRMLLELQADYFAGNRLARAVQWRRVGLYAARSGDARGARTAYLHSLAARPTRKVASAFLRTWLGPWRRRHPPAA
jgi:glycosyltransferase involved in cell wall biosynthesis